jgi:hypothetical protein
MAPSRPHADGTDTGPPAGSMTTAHNPPGSLPSNPCPFRLLAPPTPSRKRWAACVLTGVEGEIMTVSL